MGKQSDRHQGAPNRPNPLLSSRRRWRRSSPASHETDISTKVYREGWRDRRKLAYLGRLIGVADSRYYARRGRQNWNPDSSQPLSQTIFRFWGFIHRGQPDGFSESRACAECGQQQRRSVPFVVAKDERAGIPQQQPREIGQKQTWSRAAIQQRRPAPRPSQTVTLG